MVLYYRTSLREWCASCRIVTVIPAQLADQTSRAGAEAGAVGRRWYGRRPLLGAHFFPLVYKAEPGVEWSWWLHDEIWEVWALHRCQHLAGDPGLAADQSQQGGQMAVAARRL